MRDDRSTRPYEYTPAELRAMADRIEEAGITYLLVALDLRKMADAAESGPALPAGEGT